VGPTSANATAQAIGVHLTALPLAPEMRLAGDARREGYFTSL